MRGTLKAFGIRTGGGKNTLFARRIREAISDKSILAMTEPLLAAYEEGLQTLVKLDETVLAVATRDAISRRLLTVPGVVPIVALTCPTGVDAPHRSDKSRLIAAAFGLTPGVHASGKVEQVGRIAKCGEAMACALHYEAANVMMTRCRADNWLESWALKVATRHGTRKAKVALVRRFAVVMHRMWVDGTDFSMERPAAMTV